MSFLKEKKFLSQGTLILLGGLLVGCGGSQTPEPQDLSSDALAPSGINITRDDPGSESDPLSEDFGNIEGSPVMTFLVNKTGYTEHTIEVRMKDVLRVRFVPEIPNRTVSGTGFTNTYSQLGVYIKVGDVAEPTALLSNGLLQQQEQSVIFDFSSAAKAAHDLEEADPVLDPEGEFARRTVKITIKKPNYDYWCLGFGYCAPVYPEHTRVYETHKWSGTLYVQTDDTLPLGNVLDDTLF